jgi:DNA invertase Pin-like site-specific DNA recombinase
MSREHQNYSLEFQSAHNAAFAAEHSYALVKTYEDAGVSGLRLKGRHGLKQLLADVLGGSPGFNVVLVYDVSRWGRFQDIDQGGHYEFICREAGVQILYTAEPFRNDGSLGSTIVKHVKRAMAAEFSRELASKTSTAQRGLSYKGFWVNGPPGYGLRRVAVDPDRRPRFHMESGEHKALRGTRTILVAGPEEEVRTVRRIYSLFLVHGLRLGPIAALLNREGITAEAGHKWTRFRVREVLRNEKYAGALQRNKTKGALGSRHRVPRSQWVRVPKAVEPIVDAATFAAVQAQFRQCKSRNPTDAELLDDLRIVLRDHGRISHSLIDRHPQTHCAAVISRRFGGLVNAMALVDAEPTRSQLAASLKAREVRPCRFRDHPVPLAPAEALEALRGHLEQNGSVSTFSIDEDSALPGSNWYRRTFGSMSRVYELIGYEPPPAQRLRLDLARNRRTAGAELQASRRP